jgi:hypothetical protein
MRNDVVYGEKSGDRNITLVCSLIAAHFKTIEIYHDCIWDGEDYHKNR